MTDESDASAKPRFLVTGGHGFVGRRLVEALAGRAPGATIIAPSAAELDVTDADAMLRVVAAAEPDYVVHLAAMAAVTSSTRDPRQAWAVNLGGALNLVLALQAQGSAARLLHVSTGEVYGRSLDAGLPVAETALLQPNNPYAASKAAADILVAQAARSGLRAVIARPFNHIGAGQSDAFVVPSFAAQIARIEQGLQPPVLEVGSLDEERDFLHVSDVVAAYLDLLFDPLLGSAPIFNIASGQAVRIGDLLDRLLSMSRSYIQVRPDPARLRPSPTRRAVGDATLLRERLGWKPTIPLPQALSEVLMDMRRQVGERGAG